MKRSAKPEQQAQIEELQRFVSECAEEVVVSTPVKDRAVPTTPTKDRTVPVVESRLSATKRALHMTGMEEEGTVKSVCRDESDDSVLVTKKHRIIALSDSD